MAEEGPVTVSLRARGPSNPRSREILGALIADVLNRTQLDLREGTSRNKDTYTWNFLEGHFEHTAPTKLVIRLASRAEAVAVVRAYHGKAFNLGPDAFAIEATASGNGGRRRA